jgi:hypothetical protein
MPGDLYSRSRKLAVVAVAVLPLLAEILKEARHRHHRLPRKWRDVYMGLVRINEATGLLRYQEDLWIDVILRAMEDELAARCEVSLESDYEILADALQHTLTRYWVLSTHDALRSAARSNTGKEHLKLPSLYERFRLVRVPLAKFKVVGDDGLKEGKVTLVPFGEGGDAEPGTYRARSNDEYYPPTPIDERGSIGWHLFDVKTMLPVTIYRRQLSDELLALFD